MRRYGEAERYNHVTAGVNSRPGRFSRRPPRTLLPNFFAGWNARRLEIADAYSAALVDSDADLLARLDDRNHVYHLYVVEAPDCNALQRHLDDHESGYRSTT